MTLDDDDEILEYLLLYLYTKPENIQQTIWHNHEFNFKVLQVLKDLIIIADKYCVFGLVSQARDGVQSLVIVLQ